MHNEFNTVIGTTLDSQYNSILDIVTAKPEETFTVSDITVCVAIRLTEINPWVLPRLEFLLTHYSPTPCFLIVDFGSQGEFKDSIENLCKINNAQYLYIDDTNIFSLSTARNIGASYIKTKFIFFTDVDCVFESNFFKKISSLTNSLCLSIATRRCIFLPVYHLTEKATNCFFDFSQRQKKDEYLERISFESISEGYGNNFMFIAPYSNVYLITKEFFELSGGYCNIFRGHGSEDFEYLIRLGIFSSNIPLPASLNKDWYGPLKESFWQSQLDYSGFRKYVEALTIPSELQGLKTFHLFHESPSKEGYWTAHNDWKRQNFNKIIDNYYPNMENIILQDYIERPKKALCIFSDKKQWGYFVPLRLYGYKLDILCSNSDNDIHNILNKIEQNYYDRIFIFNPYMKSHAKFRGIIELSRRLGVRTTVIERGGLPNSLYYADEVVYGDHDYHNIDNILSTYIPKTLAKSKALINRICSGCEFLENQESYEVTHSKLVLLRNSKCPTIFIPLQLEDDMAVTKFTDGYPSYNEFIEQIRESIFANPDIIFAIKRHPLSKNNISNLMAENVVLVDDNTNIHALMDSCKFTIVYNSGVGMLSCIQQKPTFNIGNTYYSASTTLSNRVSSVEEAIIKIKSKQYHCTTIEDAIIFTDWLINEKYSWFSANDIIRDFSDRKSHGYDNIMVELINLDGTIINTGSIRNSYPPSPRSYLNHRITIFPVKNEKVVGKKPLPKVSEKVVAKEPLPKVSEKVVAKEPLKKSRLFNKLKKDPYRFCADSKYILIRMARILFTKKS